MKSALLYLIREKLLNFAVTAEQHPESARQLPRVVAEVWLHTPPARILLVEVRQLLAWDQDTD